jgi:hypothetical protein
MAMTIERGLLASYLDDGGWHAEAENVRKGIDLESYENELQLIDWLRRHATSSSPRRLAEAAATPTPRSDASTVGEKAEGWRVPDDAAARFVEEAAKIISGAPFPSARSLFKARQIADLALTLPTDGEE